MNKQSHFDFVTSIVLTLLALSVIISSYRMGQEVGGDHYASPGMLPMVLAVLLLFASIRLFMRSVRENGLARNFSDFVVWLGQFGSSRKFREMVLAGIFLATYTFVLAPRLPFWLSTSIFLFSLIAFSQALSLARNVLVTALVVGSVYGVFRVVFNVPLP